MKSFALLYVWIMYVLSVIKCVSKKISSAMKFADWEEELDVIVDSEGNRISSILLY